MKKSMKHKKYPKFEDYDFSDCREITGDELYRINGGGRIENSNEAVAGAEVGDTLIRDDGTEVTITQGDIDWAKDHIGGGNDSAPATPDPVNTEPSADPTNPAESTSTSSNPSSTSSGNSSANSETTVPDFADPFAPVSNGNFVVDNENQIISADINNPQSIIDAYNSYHIQADRGYKFQIKDGDEIVHTFSEAKYVRNYVKTLDPSDGKITLSEPLGQISTATAITNVTLDFVIDKLDDIDDAAKIAKLSSISNKVSTISLYSGIVGVAIDLYNVKKDPSFDTISTAVIDGIGLIPGPGTAWSIGLSCAKYEAEKLAEETDKLVKSYSDYKINEMASCYQSENERVQQMFEPSNMFWKMAETGIKQWFKRLPL